MRWRRAACSTGWSCFLTPTLGGLPASPSRSEIAAPTGPACASALQSVTYERLGDTVLVTGYLLSSAAPADAVQRHARLTARALVACASTVPCR